MTDAQVEALLRLALKNKHMLHMVMAVIEDLVQVMVPNLEQCSKEGCTGPATVQHVDLDVKMCDRHAASSIVGALHNIKENVIDNLTLVRARLADEECWLDLRYASQVRRLTELVEELQKNDVGSEPDRVRYH